MDRDVQALVAEMVGLLGKAYDSARLSSIEKTRLYQAIEKLLDHVKDQLVSDVLDALDDAEVDLPTDLKGKLLR